MAAFERCMWISKLNSPSAIKRQEAKLSRGMLARNIRFILFLFHFVAHVFILHCPGSSPKMNRLI